MFDAEIRSGLDFFSSAPLREIGEMLEELGLDSSARLLFITKL